MGPRLRDSTALNGSVPVTITPVSSNAPQRLFRALEKYSNGLEISDFILPFQDKNPLTCFFEDAIHAVPQSDFELPFTEEEIASAESIELSWIPPRFSKISKNVYIIKKLPVTQESESRCTCYGHDSQRGSSTRPTPSNEPTTRKKKGVQEPIQYFCGDACHNKLVLIECGKDTCSAPDPLLCLNRPFQQKSSKDTRVVYMGRKGFGLVANEIINPGDLIVEYVGEVIDEAMAAERRLANIASGQTHTYMLELEKDILIDAQYRGNDSRFINHSCAPNCAAQKWTCEGGIVRIGIVALQAISSGEEITFDYQFTHVEAQSVICQCGAATCKGKMGFKDKEVGKNDEKQVDAVGKVLTQPIHMSSLAVFKGSRLNRDWLESCGFNRKRLFLCHGIPYDVDVDTYNQSRPMRKKAKKNWYKETLLSDPAKTCSFLAGGVLDYTNILQANSGQAPSGRIPPPRKSYLDSRIDLIKEIHKFAEGKSRWNNRLNVQAAEIDQERVYRFVENVENGIHHQNGDTNDLNEDSCHRCGTAGELICCDGCPAAFHLSCAGLHNLPPANVSWYCASCKRSRSVPCVSQRSRVQVNPIFQVQPTPEQKLMKRRPGRPKRIDAPTSSSSSSPDSEES